MIVHILFYVVSWFIVGLITQAIYRAVGGRGVLSGYDCYFWSAMFGYLTPFIIVLGNLFNED